jgi:hypothetical protein
VPPRFRAAVHSILSDRDKFVSLLNIKDKQTHKLTKFQPNTAQRKLWDLLDHCKRVIVIKARQVGVSTAVRAWQLNEAYKSPDPLNFAVLSFHDRSAKNLRTMDRQWLAELPEMMKRVLSVDSAEDTVFADTRAGISSFTTGGRGGTRSFSFTGGHLSEFAFYVNPDEVLAQTMSTVGEGPIVIESTVNAPGDAFHRLIMGAPENGWQVFTYWWWEHQPYRDADLPADWERTDMEEQLAVRYGLDDHQLAWRRRQIATLGLSKFQREYPACLDDAFLSRDSTYFDADDLNAITEVWFDSAIREFEAPVRNEAYTIGVDVSGGVGGDYHAMAVIAVGSRQPVYIERNNTLAPHAWAERVVTTAMRYNNATVLCESNNHGHVVLREMENLKYHKVWCDHNGSPWVTTVKSKIDAYDTLREMVCNRLIWKLDQTTLQELRSIQILKVTPQAPAGLHDDLAMALALGYRALRDVPASLRREHGNNRSLDVLVAHRVNRIRRQATPWRSQ